MKTYFKILFIFITLFTDLILYSSEKIDNQGLEGLDLLFITIPDVIGVSKIQEKFNTVPMSVYVVTNDELNRWGIRNQFEIFQRIPGYSFYNSDYAGENGIIGRGLSSIWRYGYSIELLPIYDWGDWKFSNHFFKNLEIARGPGGITWGSVAEAGLINANIRDDLEGWETHIDFGNYNRQAFDILYGTKTADNETEVFVGYHYEKQDAQIQNDAFDVEGTKWKTYGVLPSYSVIGKIKHKSFKFVCLQNFSDNIMPTVWGEEYLPLQEAIESTIGSNAHDSIELTGYRAEAHLPNFYNIFGLYNAFDLYFYHDSYYRSWWMEGNCIDTQKKRTVGINGSYSGEKLVVDFGGDFWGLTQLNVPSSDYAFALNYLRYPDGSVMYNYENAFVENYYSRNFYIQTKYNFSEKFTGLLGVRWDYQKNDPVEENIFSGPRIGLFYALNEKLNFKYLYNNTKRRPQSNEISMVIPGLNTLNPEMLNTHEFVVNYDIIGKFKVELTLFNQKLKDEIAWDSPNDGYNNFSGVKNTGVEWVFKYLTCENKLILYWNGSYNNLDGSFGSGDILPSGKKEFAPSLTSFIGADCNVLDIFWFNVALRSIQDIPYMTKELENEDKVSVNFVDITIRSKKMMDKKMDISLYIINAFNNHNRIPAFGEHYFGNGGTIDPEDRRIFARASYYF